MAIGEFTAAGGFTRNRVAQYFANGTLDPAFNPNADGFVHGLLVQPDERIVTGGLFTTMSGVSRNRAVRCNADGTLDLTFQCRRNDAQQRRTTGE